MAGAGAEGGAAMGVWRDGAAGGGGEDCLGAILGGGEAARPRLGIVSLVSLGLKTRNAVLSLALTQINGDV